MMSFSQKLTLAFATMLLSPSVIVFIAFGRWSQDNLDLTLPALVYMAPILLMALAIRHFFHATKTACGFYVVCMGVLLVLAIGTLWSELHGPVFGQVYIPTIVLSFPFGLMAILDHSAQKK